MRENLCALQIRSGIFTTHFFYLETWVLMYRITKLRTLKATIWPNMSYFQM